MSGASAGCSKDLDRAPVAAVAAVLARQSPQHHRSAVGAVTVATRRRDLEELPSRPASLVQELLQRQAARLARPVRRRQRGELPPIARRGDVVTLRRFFSAGSRKSLRRWLRAYALREPQLVTAYFAGGWAAVQQARCAATFRYRYLPTQTLGKLNPATIRCWDREMVDHVVEAMQKVLAKPSLANVKLLERKASKLIGVGVYVKAHLSRTLLMMAGARYPSDEFLVMGRGANSRKYQALKDMGITDVRVFNTTVRSLGLLPEEESYIDAGESGYLICMTDSE